MKGEGLVFILKDSWHGQGHGSQSENIRIKDMLSAKRLFSAEKLIM